MMKTPMRPIVLAFERRSERGQAVRSQYTTITLITRCKCCAHHRHTYLGCPPCQDWYCRQLLEKKAELHSLFEYNSNSLM